MKKSILINLFVSLLSILSIQITFAQAVWQQAGGPSGAYINQIYAGPGGYVYTVIPDYSNPMPYDGIYRSSDYADSWEFIEVPAFTWINGVDKNGNIFISVNDTVLRSTDHGDSWIPVYTEIDNFGMLMDGNGDTLYIHGNDLLMSDDNGLTWNLTDTTYAYFMVVNSAGYLIRSTVNNELFISYNNGSSWEVFANVPTLSDIQSMAINQQDEIFIGTDASGIYKLSADGNEWEFIPEIFFKVDYIEVTNEGTIFIRTYLGIPYVSYDDGQTWAGSTNGMMSFTAGGFTSADSVVYTGWQEGIYKTMDDGQTWSDATEGINKAEVSSLEAAPDGTLYARTPKRLLKSTDRGDSWQLIYGGASHVDLIKLFVLPDTTVYLVTEDLSIDKSSADSCHDYSCTHLYRSSDGGASWLKVLDASYISDMTMDPQGNIFLSTETTVWTSPDNGLSWEAVYSNTPGFGFIASDSSGNLYGKGYEGLFKSEDGALSWQLVSMPEYDNMYLLLRFEMSASGIMYSLSSYQSGDEYELALYRSADFGLTWDEITPQVNYIYDIYPGKFENLYLSTGIGLLRSTDLGETYTNISSEETSSITLSSTEDITGRLYASIFRRSVYFSDTYVDVKYTAPPQKEISYYPNPARNIINILLTDSKSANLKIYNIQGEVIKSQRLTSAKTRIELNNIPSGIYTLTVNEKVAKLIIIK